MNKKVLFGWLSISIALLLSAYANYNCSFGCQGIWGTMYNPITIIGLVLYAIGTYLLLSVKK
jgi:hypothetical protein